MNFTREDWDAIRAACKAQIADVILAKMAEESVKLTRFGNVDEEIYTHTTRLMAAYEEIIGLYERYNDGIISPEVREIIDGIITLLVSRLREFEDLSNQSDKNPVTEEKQAIIANAMEQMESDITTEIPKLYESYKDHLNLCRGQLNDLNNRRMVQLYLALMEDEWEILSSIIKIQVHALEQAVEHAAANTLEKMAVHKILSLLREAYQHFGRASTEVSAVFHNLESAVCDEWQPESYEHFEAVLAERSNFEDDPGVAMAKTEVCRRIAALFGEYRLEFLKSTYRFRRMINDEMMLANEMINIFVSLNENWPKTPKESPGEGPDILRGVEETIEIKIEALKESVSQMAEECNGLIEVFISQNASPANEDIESAKEVAWQLWMDSPDGFLEACAKLPVFEERKLEQEKTFTRTLEALERKLTKFKREILLYEISTYEEIIFYSISRLRELEEYEHEVSLADGTLNLLEIMLKKNSIEVIRPKPHDPFSPKEHEVLMAESNPDFKKGEIVKLMNSGYRQRDMILLRANVIAAR